MQQHRADAKSYAARGATITALTFRYAATKVLSMNPWLSLTIAIFFEIIATLMLKQSAGFTKIYWALGSIAAYIIWFWFFAPAIQALPVGVAYAIWSGIGIAAVTLISYFIFDQSLSVAQVSFIALILVGAIGLNLTTQA